MCYVVSIAAAAVTSLAWSRSKSIKVWWLTLMFYGGALFGVIDHLWNGELFLVSVNTPKDLILGVLIVVTTILLWGIMLLLSKFNPTLAKYIDVQR